MRILPKLAEGSEHLVYLDEPNSDVIKFTKPGIFGEFYEIIAGRITQFKSTPLEYLWRLMIWEKLFGCAPVPIGVTESGQVVSRQRFVLGSCPTQDAVNEFLTRAGLTPVRMENFLWKSTDPESSLEGWIGDTRDENFVQTESGIIPIDLRLWVMVNPAFKSD